MKKRILSVLLALGLTLGGSAIVGVSPASAHWDQSPYSFASCGSTEPSGHVLLHMHVLTMGVYPNGVSWLRSYCESTNGGVFHCGWVAEQRSWGGVSQWFVYSGPSGACD